MVLCIVVVCYVQNMSLEDRVRDILATFELDDCHKLFESINDKTFNVLLKLSIDEHKNIRPFILSTLVGRHKIDRSALAGIDDYYMMEINMTLMDVGHALTIDANGDNVTYCLENGLYYALSKLVGVGDHVKITNDLIKAVGAKQCRTSDITLYALSECAGFEHDLDFSVLHENDVNALLKRGCPPNNLALSTYLMSSLTDLSLAIPDGVVLDDVGVVLGKVMCSTIPNEWNDMSVSVSAFVEVEKMFMFNVNCQEMFTLYNPKEVDLLRLWRERYTKLLEVYHTTPIIVFTEENLKALLDLVKTKSDMTFVLSHPNIPPTFVELATRLS